MIDRERRRPGRIVRERTQRHLRPARRPDIDVLQCIGTLLSARVHFQDHMVLVQLRKDGRHLALAIGVIESIVDRLGQDPQTRGRVTVNDQLGL